jgi:Putative bacterial sensory transduction regulator
MDGLVSFGPHMFQRFVQDHGLRYLVSDEGDYMIPMNVSGLRLDCWLTSEDDGQVVRVLVCAPGERFPRDQECEVQAACDAWNRTRRWPKACWYLPDNDDRGEILLQGSLPVAHEVTQELISEFLCVHIDGSIQFWAEFSLDRELTAR